MSSLSKIITTFAIWYFMRMILRKILSLIILCTSLTGFADSTRPVIEQDTLLPKVQADTVQKSKNIFKKIIAYFDDTNKPKQKKKFDISFIGGPHYSSDTQLGIGLMAAGNYYMKGDTTVMPSNVSLYGDVSTVGFYLLGIRGNNIFPDDKMRLEYNVNFYSFPTNFWGIGYRNGRNKNNETSYDLFSTKFSANLYFKVTDGLYAGPQAQFVFMRGSKISPEYLYLWENQRLKNITGSVGFSAKYDTRDSYTGPSKGWLISLTQLFSPRFIGNKMAFSSTQITGSHYRRIWKGGILAATIGGNFNYGNVPWTMMATFGGGKALRGYYEGRYRDKIEVEAVVELRQHVWRRNGIVVWGGAASVAPSVARLRSKELLPCTGIGYRWEFKKNTNIRFDFGIGRGETSFNFNINEAF